VPRFIFDGGCILFEDVCNSPPSLRAPLALSKC